MMLSMRRIQIHLDEDVDDALAGQALERGIPKAALIREYLAQHVSPRRRGRDDPSERLTGIYAGTPQESNRVNDILYGSAVR